LPTRLIITDPEPPTWWGQHKAVFCTVVGLVIGLWLGNGCSSVLATHPAPGLSPGISPSPALTGTSAPRPTPSSTKAK